MAISDVDWALVALIEGISVSGGELGLTVFTGGLAVSGVAVPEEVYFRRIGLEAVAAEAVESRERRRRETAELNEQFARDDLPDAERQSLEARADELERKFIVMVDVTIFGAGDAPLQAATWRGRLSQLSGWTMGTFEPPRV